MCGFLLLAVAMVFGPTVPYGFVNYDDNVFVAGNRAIQSGLSVAGVRWAMTTSQGSQWAPLTWISYLADYDVYGLRPWGYHLTNVLLHAATSVLLFLVLRAMTGALWPSAFVAAVFAVHPLQVESVAWVAERKGLLCGLFFVLTLGAYLRWVRRPCWHRYVAVTVLFALALMAKPVAVTLPFVLLLLDYWPQGRLDIKPRPVVAPNGATAGRAFVGATTGRGFVPLVIEKLPLLLLTAAACVAAPLAQGRAVISLTKLPFPARIANALVSCVAYLGHAFFPTGLAVFYPHPEGGWPAAETAAALLLLAGISAGVWAARRRAPYLLVGWFWYLGMLVPVIGLVQVGSHAMADRYMYLPQIGLMIATAWGCSDLVRSWPRRQWICGTAGAAALVVLIGCARIQAGYWRDSVSLWTHTLKCTSRNNRAYFNLGAELARLKRYEEAIEQYRESLKILPDDAVAHSNLGFALARLGRWDEVAAEYEAALKIQPRNVELLSDLGNALARQGRLDEAIDRYRRALAIEPGRTESTSRTSTSCSRFGRDARSKTSREGRTNAQTARAPGSGC